MIGETNQGNEAFGILPNGNAGFAGGLRSTGLSATGGGSFGGDLGVGGTAELGVGIVDTNLSVYGDLQVNGRKNFQIDDPLDPANRYLYHSAIESSEMMNIYSGNVTTDGHGDATVHVPAWFEALNGDFRYQLTVIGQFAQAIVADEIYDGRFRIRTDKPCQGFMAGHGGPPGCVCQSPPACRRAGQACGRAWLLPSSRAVWLAGIQRNQLRS
ncbi:MAG: hypothetical protein WCC25_06790 [Candidatus Korobacteraceae bacterium]